MKVWAQSKLITRSYQGREFTADTWYELDDLVKFALKLDEDFIQAIDSGFIDIGYANASPLASPEKAISFLKSDENFRSSFALDLENNDQSINTDDPEIIIAIRKLWDLIGDFDLSSSKFFPPIDGVWNANGTITVKDPVNVAKIQIEIWRNDEPWFTVAQATPQVGSTFIPFSCDVDAYKSEGHDFDLRIHLQKINETDPCSITISGSDEETAWGMTFLQQLVTPSPT
jgi:hypothetical protein